jgi:hypothetical protein
MVPDQASFSDTSTCIFFRYEAYVALDILYQRGEW